MTIFFVKSLATFIYTIYMVVNGSEKVAKSSTIKHCLICDYTTCRTNNFKKHINSIKHIKRENGSKMVVNDSKIATCSNINYNCICGKIFKYNSGYYRHKKTCHNEENNSEDEEKKLDFVNKEFIITVLKQNQEILKENNELKYLLLNAQNQMMEVIKNGTIQNNTNNTINTNNSNNKTFNLQVFLNETCKDALNLSEFIDSLKITMSDLERFGSHGYVEGISNIFIKGLKQLDVSKRPIHCTDLKRETIFLKEKNVWEKEDEERNTIKKAIKSIAHKNTKVLPAWKEANPLCMDVTSKKNTQYMKILSESMGAYTHEEHELNCNKIIKNVSREVTIHKNQLVL
jgi:hypothetical protein